MTPAQLAEAWERRQTSQMWRSATNLGLVGLLRGCEFALSEGEAFQVSEHLTPQDVKFFEQGGRRHARVRMRKRKDLRVLRGKQTVVVVAGRPAGTKVWQPDPSTQAEAATAGPGETYFDPVDDMKAWLAARESLTPPRL